MALRALYPSGWSRPFRGVGPGPTGACCCPAAGGRGRSVGRSGDLRRSVGRLVAIVGRRAGARLCRGGSPHGPVGPGVTGCCRGASYPGYSAARAEAAAPPFDLEDPSLPGARTTFSPKPTPTDLTQPGPTRPDRVQRKQVGVPHCARRRLGAFKTTAPSRLPTGGRRRAWGGGRTDSWDL